MKVTADKRFQRIFDELDARRKKRIAEAGKHKCVRVECGSLSRVTGGKDGRKILKRPVVYRRFYECKICGRDMNTPPKGEV